MEKFTPLAKFYTPASSDGKDKTHLGLIKMHICNYKVTLCQLKGDIAWTLTDHWISQFSATSLQLDFIQCPFPNQIQFGLEKLRPKITYDFPNQFQFGLERKKMILQDADSKPNSDWFGKFWWPLSMSWKFQTKFSLVWKNHWSNTQSSTAQWADRDTPSAGHPCTAQRSPWCTRVQRTQSTLPSSQSSTPRNTQWHTLVSSHHGRLHAQHCCNALRTPLNI